MTALSLQILPQIGHLDVCIALFGIRAEKAYNFAILWQKSCKGEGIATDILFPHFYGVLDFFSIGTNDLTQYTLAIDRQNANLDSFYDAHHPAVLKLIQMITDNAHVAGIWVGICGELGADTTLTRTFLDMGIDELSVSPGCILPVRKAIRETE